MNKLSLLLYSSLALTSSFVAKEAEATLLDIQQEQPDVVNVKKYLTNEEIETISSEAKTFLSDALGELSQSLAIIAAGLEEIKEDLEGQNKSYKTKKLFTFLRSANLSLKLITQIAPYKILAVKKSEVPSQSVLENAQNNNQAIDGNEVQNNQQDTSTNVAIETLNNLLSTNEEFRDCWQDYLTQAQNILNTWFASNSFQSLTQELQLQGIYLDIMINIMIDTVPDIACVDSLN
jgi:hypothetical protein